jgi:ADP-ribose pyrophosphatase YjhB (NUDIX family)
MQEQIITLAKRIKSISDIGLLYSSNQYDIERYEELQEISFDLLSEISGLEVTALKDFYKEVTDYPTPKIDVLGVLLDNESRILLAKESADGKWSLPGGWADIGLTPKEVIIKEFKEETGLDIEPQQLLAVYDKKCYPHPPQPFYVYKMVFYCKALSHEIVKGFDVLDVSFFPIDDLPTLSKERILESQLEELYDKILRQDWMCKVD